MMQDQARREGTLSSRCYLCKKEVGEASGRYFCCSKAEAVCEKCASTMCKSCKKKRVNILKVVRCSSKRCRRLFAQEDMFYDFKGSYYLCPYCIKKDYTFYYQKAIKDKQPPKQVTLQTSYSYPYQDLMVYFQNWCFCCASRIGQEDAFEMVMGARICSPCISFNIDLMQYMIKCIDCQGYIHRAHQIYEKYSSSTDILCKYCAERQKEHMSNKEIEQLESPRLHKKQLFSALDKSKLKSQKSIQKDPKNFLSKASKISSINSFEEQILDLRLNVNSSTDVQVHPCDVCGCLFSKGNIMHLDNTDPKNSSSILGLFQKGRNQLRLCFVCFGQNFSDRGQTIEFETPFFRQQPEKEKQVVSRGQAKGVKSMILPGASHGIFK